MAQRDLSLVLTDLLKAGAPHVDFKKPSLKGFETLVDSFGEATTPAKKGLRKMFGGSLAPLGMDASGGYFAEWAPRSGEKPIIYFGSEGQTYVAARDLRELLGQLPYCLGDGWGIQDAMKYWFNELTALDDELEKLPTAPATDDQKEADRRMVSVLDNNEIPIVDDLLGTIEAANRKYLWVLVDAVDSMVSGYPSFKLWWDAWNEVKGTPRTFSPKERYEVGECIRYPSKQPGADGLGRGVVIAHPAPNRVLIGDQRVTFVRAYGDP